jgi:hypothetical protein
LEAASTHGHQRALDCLNVKKNAATTEFRAQLPAHLTNGDEQRYPTKIGSYSKGLPHNSIGEVDLTAYGTYMKAIVSGLSTDFENITLGGNTPLVDPQSGLAFDLEGQDSHGFAIGPPPALASQQRADEAVEDYWMALCRDTNFTDYATDPNAIAAASELSTLGAFNGPKVNGQVNSQTLFRGQAYGDTVGPYVSQFLLFPLSYGGLSVTQTINTYPGLLEGGQDYLTDAGSWLAVQNGQGPFGSNIVDSSRRYIRRGRDLGAYVHVDVLFEAYLNACIWLIDNNAPLNPGNPYNSSKTQTGFGTFGSPHLKALCAEVATRALKTVWFQKWFVHRCLRPEAFGGLVHFTKTGQANYPLHSDILNSQAVANVFAKNGTYFLPHEFPEGCPWHPSYGQGHGTVAGACATVVKAFFDDTVPIQNIGTGTEIVTASEDGLSLVPYTGSDAGQVTVATEMNKLAANIALGRNHAAVHWRSDYWDSVLLGEALAITILQDQKSTYNESFAGFTFTKFDGTQITV